jgi:hypothetical protein
MRCEQLTEQRIMARKDHRLCRMMRRTMIRAALNVRT